MSTEISSEPTPTEPATTDGHESTDDESSDFPQSFDELTLAITQAHQDLMGAYVGALNMAGWRWNSVPRRFVHSHIKGKLREISNAYRQLGQMVAADQSQFREWLRETAEDCEKVAAPLVSWRAPGVLAALPGAIFGLTRTVRFHGPLAAIHHHSALLTISFYLIGYPLALLGFVCVSAGRGFNEKRWIFDRMSIYKYEDDLFKVLGRPKRPEALTDNTLLLVSQGLLLPGAVGALAYLQIRHGWSEWWWAQLPVAASLLLLLARIKETWNSRRGESDRDR